MFTDMFEKIKKHQNILIICFVVLVLVFLYYKSTENFGNNNSVYFLWEAKNATFNNSLLENKLPQNLLDSRFINSNVNKTEKNIAVDLKNVIYNFHPNKTYKTMIYINIPKNNGPKKSAKLLIKVNELINRNDDVISGVAIATKTLSYTSDKEATMTLTSTLRTKESSMHNLFITVQLIDGDFTALPDTINATVRVEEVTK
jgi:hypothetical protein